GSLQWQAEGLRPPSRVQVATQDYFETADAFRRWVEECLELRPNAKMTRAAAFASWKSWAESAGEYVGSTRRLVERLEQVHGVNQARLPGGNRERIWLGIGLRGGEA